ncbi:MAG: rhomboid family intramembrane serine protease [Bacteroidales bacterium]|nr:rhomboid family intramembrane serine protease [Bacteroidales bacterium]
MFITLIIIAVTAITSILALNNRALSDKLLFSPYMISNHRQGYRFLTHALVHGDWMHLLVNMFVLFSFGQAVEAYYSQLFMLKGAYFYTLLYVGGTALSSTPSFAKHKTDPYYRAVGASGAVSAVVFASILIEPLSPIRFAFFPVDIPAFIFGALYLAYSAYMARKGHDNIGHDAHFYGAVFGIVFTLILKPALFMGFINKIGIFLGA